MDIWLIYRKITINGISKIKPIEYCTSEEEAAKFHKLFNLQIPVDLKNKLSHHYIYTSVIE